MDIRGSWMRLNLYATFDWSGIPFIFIFHCMFALIFFPSSSRALLGSICLSYSIGLFIHKQFKVAPLSAIGYKFLARRSWEMFILVLLLLLIISLTLSHPHSLGLPYEFSPMLSALVAFSLCPTFLYLYVLLSWPISKQCPCVQQYPPTSWSCFLLTHFECVWLCLSPGNPGPLSFPEVSCWSCLVNVATFLVRSVMVLFWDIIVSLSSSAAVTMLMRSSCVPSISFMLFASWYPPARVVMIYASFCTSSALTGSAPGIFPRFSHTVVSHPTCRIHRRIDQCYTRACKLYQQYLRLRSSALCHPQILGFPGPVALIPGTACLRPRAPTTLRDFRGGLGSPPECTPWRGVWRCPSPGDGQIPDYDQILQREMFCWRPPRFAFSLHTRGLFIIWIILLLPYGCGGGFPRWRCLSLMGCWVGLDRSGLQTRFPVPQSFRRRLAVGLWGGCMSLLLS